MSEKEFVNEIVEKLESGLPEKYKENVLTGESLIYKIIVNEQGEFQPTEPSKPSRGNFAFQTDVLIKNKNDKLPRLVIEVKYGGFSTHDILTYSTKAIRHKEIYPYLRYGLVVGGTNVITNKFFTHNVGFDFALAIPDLSKDDFLIEVIKEQLVCAEDLLEILTSPNKIKYYNSIISVEKI